LCRHVEGISEAQRVGKPEDGDFNLRFY
jgi:hypothetical protein